MPYQYVWFKLLYKKKKVKSFLKHFKDDLKSLQLCPSAPTGVLQSSCCWWIMDVFRVKLVAKFLGAFVASYQLDDSFRPTLIGPLENMCNE